MANKDKVNIVPADTAPGFLAITATNEDGVSIADVLAENVGPQGITPADLERIKVPGSGGTFWTIPTAEGERAVKAVEGVVLHARDVRGYWQKKFGDDAGMPPVCSSADGEIGVCLDETLGLGGECEKCPMAQWGTATDDKGNALKGQACKKRRLLFVLSEDSPMPFVISAPPTSLNAIRKYAVRLTGQVKRMSDVVTAFELAKLKNPAGIDYAVISPRYVRDLDPQERVAISNYMRKLLPAFQSARIEHDAAE